MQEELEIFQGAFASASYLLLFTAIYFIPHRKTRVKTTFLMIVPFLIISYLGSIAGLACFYLLAPYTLSINFSFTLTSIPGLPVSSVTAAVIFAFFCIEALFYKELRRTGDSGTDKLNIVVQK